MGRIRGWIAVSADGRIADGAGELGWLEPFAQIDFGYHRFLSGIATVAMGRETFDEAMRRGGGWPYAGKAGRVLTSRPVEAPPAVAARSDLAELIAELRALQGDAWAVGGAKFLGGLLRAGGLDRLELFVMPVALGAGPSLLEGGGGAVPLRLQAVETLPSDVVRLDYAV